MDFQNLKDDRPVFYTMENLGRILVNKELSQVMHVFL
jgi:hypothetical protein